ncbi:MAG: flagellar filament capping protein FliD [Thiotrichales bacterium]|nr:flagellar filament capping protein FliD [Thiotrichales bacterium]
MGTITAPGVGSGLDISGIIQSLVAVEREPLNRIEANQSAARIELSAFGRLNSSLETFESALNELDSFSSFRIFETTTSDEDIATATASSDAAEGETDIVITQLAQRNVLSSVAFADTNTIVGEGTLTISVGADSFDVVIGSTNSTLSGIRDAINNASDNTGITATVINANDGSRLIFSSDDEGVANALTLTGGGALTSLSSANLTVQEPPLDAQFTVSGFAVTSSSNTVSNVLQGVTFELEAIGASTITVGRNNSAVQESVQEFVDAFNAVNTTITQLRAGDLQGESLLLTIVSDLRNVFNTATTGLGGTFSSLSEIGVAFNDEGALALDADALTTALNADFRGVSNLFADPTQGYVTRLQDIAEFLVQTGGLIDSREEGVNTRIDNFDARIEQFELRLISIERRLTTQFSALDTLLSSLNNTSRFLTSSLASLPTIQRR